jgi:hypothetical protein
MGGSGFDSRQGNGFSFLQNIRSDTFSEMYDSYFIRLTAAEV